MPRLLPEARLGLIGLVTILVGCGTDNVSRHSFHDYIEDGIRIAENSGGPKFHGELFSYEPLFELHQDTTRSESLLYRPNSFIVDSAGWCYVADTGNHRIAVFDSMGTFRYQIGRQGSGPGELTNPVRILLRDGLLNVLSIGPRATVFERNGRFVEVIRDPIAGVFPLYLERLPDGGLMAIKTISKVEHNSTLAASQVVIKNALDSITTISSEYVRIAERKPVTLLGQSTTIPAKLRFGPSPQATYSPQQGLLMTTGSRPDLVWYDLSGQEIGVVRLNLETVLVTEDEKNEVLSYFEKETAKASGQDRQLREAMQQTTTFAVHKAYWDEVFVDSHGYVWLRIPGSRVNPEDTHRPVYRVLSPDGEYLGDSTWPLSKWGTVADSYLLIISTYPDTGLPMLVVYRMDSNSKRFIYP